MNTKQSYRGFKSTKWDNKTDSQKVKTLKNQYEKLGYKIPKYLQKQKLSEKQFLSALNRIDKAYQKRIEKEQPKIKLSDIQYEVNKYNKLVDTRLNQFQKMGFSDKAIEYVKGKMQFLTIGDRPFISNNSLLEKIDIDGLKANQEGRRNTLNIIKNNYNKLKDKNYLNNILNSKGNEVFLVDFLNSETFNNLDESSKLHLLNKFKNLNIVQQEVVIQASLNELKERYENSGELEHSHVGNVYSNISKLLDDVTKEI